MDICIWGEELGEMNWEIRIIVYTLCTCVLSLVRLFVTPWIVARQAPLSKGFSRQEYWSGLPFPPPSDLPDPGIKPMSPASPALAGGFFTTETPGKPTYVHYAG